MVSVRRLCNNSPAPFQQKLEQTISQLDVDLQGKLDDLSLDELIDKLRTRLQSVPDKRPDLTRISLPLVALTEVWGHLPLLGIVCLTTCALCLAVFVARRSKG